MKKTEKYKRTGEVRIEVDESDIRAFLKSKGEDVPAGASIFVMVPGGGDWSNEALPIGDCPVVVTWESEVDE